MPKMKLKDNAGRLVYQDGKEVVRLRPGQVANVPKGVAERYAHKLQTVANNVPATADRLQPREGSDRVPARGAQEPEGPDEKQADAKDEAQAEKKGSAKKA